MKKLAKQSTIFALVIFGAIIFSTSCQDEFSEETFIDPMTVAKPGGGIVSLMNGNVTLEFPQGAVNTDVSISVYECEENGCNDFLIKAIEISPKMAFQKPVMLKLRFDCNLANGNINTDSMSPYGCCWNSERVYMHEGLPEMLTCEVDKVNKTISFCISKTGVFAVKCANLQP